MQRLGEIEVEGERGKGPSKAFRAHFGHTPLSAEEAIPWHGKRLYVGTGMYGALPIMSEVYAAAEEKGIEVVARPTPEVCAVLQSRSGGESHGQAQGGEPA
jgi:hypothetical protein